MTASTTPVRWAKIGAVTPAPSARVGTRSASPVGRDGAAPTTGGEAQAEGVPDSPAAQLGAEAEHAIEVADVASARGATCTGAVRLRHLLGCGRTRKTP